jgi:hypothetical protein
LYRRMDTDHHSQLRRRRTFILPWHFKAASRASKFEHLL